jgi:hypothetical protein
LKGYALIFILALMPSVCFAEVKEILIQNQSVVINPEVKIPPIDWTNKPKKQKARKNSVFGPEGCISGCDQITELIDVILSEKK